MDIQTPPPPPIEHAKALGEAVTILRRSLSYSTIGAIYTALLLSIVFFGFSDDFWENPIALAITTAVFVGFFVFLLSQRYSWLVLHEYGLRLTTLGRQQVVLWADIESLAPTYSYIASIYAIIDLKIERRSGGKVVLGNTWIPYEDFTSLMTLLLSPSSTLLNGNGCLCKVEDKELSTPEALSLRKSVLVFVVYLMVPLLLPAILFTALTSNVGLGNLPGFLKAPVVLGIVAVVVWLFYRSK